MNKLYKNLVALVCLVLLVAACIPSGQQINDFLSSAEQTAAAQITFVPVTYTPDVNVVVAQTFAAMTVQAILQPPASAVPSSTPTPTITLTPEPGSISGSLSYPSEAIPPLRIVAFNVNGYHYQYVDTLAGWTTYQITGLPPGVYHVVAYIMGGGYAGGYTPAVACGLAVDCTDHSLLDVLVLSGQDTPDIDPADWYAPQDSFPPYPLP